MKFRYTIIYVDDVKRTLEWYRDAFGFKIKFLVETGEYGELATGETLLAFANMKMAEMNLPDGHMPVNGPKPAAFEIAFTTDDVTGALDKAVEAGAALIAAPKEKPWGQTVAFARAPEGTVIEIATPMQV